MKHKELRGPALWAYVAARYTVLAARDVSLIPIWIICFLMVAATVPAKHFRAHWRGEDYPGKEYSYSEMLLETLRRGKGKC